MKNFFEGLKDILYDGIDYIMMVIVILIVALVINWRLGGLFAKDATDTLSEKPSSTIGSEDISSKNEKEDNHNIDNDSSKNQEDDKNRGQQDEVSENEKEPTEIIKVTIPAGSLPAEIGDILVSKGLVHDKNEFVEKAVELNMETKLKSGEFEIEKNSSLEEIIKVLAK